MPRNRLFWFRNPSVESCVFGNLRSAWSYGDNLTIQCFFFFLTKKGLWPHSLGNGLSSKAFEDCLSERLNEMQNGSRTGPVLLREHVPVLGESHCRVLHIFFSSELFKRSPLVSAYFFFFFPTSNLYGHFFKFVPDGFSHRMIDYPLSCELCG